MKRLTRTALVFATALVLALSVMSLTVMKANAGRPAGEETTQEILGGFTPAEDGELTEELKEIFDKATEGLVGVSYKPIKLLETQLVSGMNYKFLAESQVVAPGAEAKQAVVTVYRSLSGEVSILDITNAM